MARHQDASATAVIANRPGQPTGAGRLSYEMALKVARVVIPVVASVSAPTSLCVSMLDRLNITMIAFCRPRRATVHTHAERVAWPARPKSWVGQGLSLAGC